MEKKVAPERFYYIDFLNVISVFLIIMIHVPGFLVPYSNSDNYWWKVILFFSITRFAVPLYILSSGAMILKKPVDNIKNFFVKRFSRVAIPFLFWGMVYEINVMINYRPKTFFEILHDFFFQDVMFHLWFVYMILAMYVFTPIFSEVLKNISQKILKYSFGVWIFLSCVVSIEYWFYEGISHRFWFVEFIGYFVAGWIIHNQKINFVKLNGYITALIAGIMIFLSSVLVVTQSFKYNEQYEAFFEPYFILIVIGSLIIFKYFREKEEFFRRHKKFSKIFSKLSVLTYGIYLIHVLVLNFTREYFFIFNQVYFAGNNYTLSMILYGIVTWGISMLIVAIFHNIPYLRRLV